MATTLSKCLALSLLSSNQSRSSDHRKKIATNYSSQSYYKESIPMVNQLRSLSSVVTEDYTPITHKENIVKVKNILMQVDDPLESMLTADYLQKLGIDYHFKEEMEAMLVSLHENVSHNESKQITNDLFQVTLFFRLLRQAGYPITSDVFKKFTDKEGRFKSALRRDIQGLLSLYEASHLNVGEEMLHRANEFASKHLESCIGDLEPNVARIVNHTMKHPCHMTISRYNSAYYLDNCRKRYGINRKLEEFARLDFNTVQSLHKSEFEEILRWWKSTGLADELKFARNQPLKWYLWPMTMLPAEPRFSNCRIQLTKIIAFIYIIDDIFDIYGSPDELNIFTNAINKWDLSIVATLPPYMQSCYTSLYNITNEIAQAIYKEQGWNPINSLKKSWMRLCNAFLIESRWFRSKHIPKADEYLRNAVISSGVHTVMMHAFFFFGDGITKENVNILESGPAIMSCPATILRLWDDLGSAKDENQDGFDGSYLHCYMKEHPQCSNISATDHVKKIISNTWQNLNKECFSRDHFAPNLVAMSLNTARMIEVMYRYDDNQNLPILEDYTNVLMFKAL